MYTALIVIGSVIYYIFGIRKIAGYMIYNVNQGRLSRVDTEDIFFCVFIGLMLGWSWPLVVSFYFIKRHIDVNMYKALRIFTSVPPLDAWNED